MGVADFGDLRVYRVSFECAMQVFRRSAAWPREERYSLTNQIRRSSRSICGCLAEAWSKRRYPAHFVSKVTDALAECRETQVWLDFALECEYLSRDEHMQLRGSYDSVGRMLTRMAAQADRWSGSPPD